MDNEPSLSIIEAILTYAVSIIRIPKRFYISFYPQLVARFWLRKPRKNQGIHWQGWNRLLGLESPKFCPLS